MVDPYGVGDLDAWLVPFLEALGHKNVAPDGERCDALTRDLVLVLVLARLGQPQLDPREVGGSPSRRRPPAACRGSRPP